MPDYPGKTIVSDIMQGLRKNSRQICRDTTLPNFEVIALIQGRMSFDQDKADKFGNAYPDSVTSAQWMEMQAEYDAGALVWVPNHPGWYVVSRIMRGCYDASEKWVTPNNIELADKLSVTQQALDDLINWKEPIDAAMAQKLAAEFPDIGIDEEKWLELQVNYEENYAPPDTP